MTDAAPEQASDPVPTLENAPPRGDGEADGAPMISVVIPCLNEEQSVAKCVEKAMKGIAASGLTGEVVVSDNASEDDSANEARRAGARVVHEPRRGYGSAYLKGFAAARGRYFVMGDADETYDFEDIPRFIEPLHRGDVDMVMGTRLKGDILPGAMPWTHRWIGNPILSGMLKILFRTKISDSHCGMRSFTREAYEKMELQTTGMEFASEIVVGALRNRLRIDEIPITYYPREGESKLQGVRDAWRHVRFMLLFSPSYLFLIPGLLLCVMGLTFIALLGAGPRELFGRTWDFHVLLFGCLSLILGYNVVIFDLVAKRFSVAAGFVKSWQYGPIPFFTLEKGLVLGALFLLAGFGLEAKIIYDWASAGFGELMALRGVTIGMTSVVLGLQTIFASFLLSLTLIKRRGPSRDE